MSSRSRITCARTSVRLAQQRLLVDEVPADDVVLRVFAIAHELPDERDHLLGVRGLLLSVGQCPQPLEQLALLLPRCCRRCSNLRGPRRAKFLTLPRRAAPACSAAPSSAARDVDLAGTAHPVRVQERPIASRASRPPATPAARRGILVGDLLQILDRRPGAGESTSATSSSASPISDVMLAGSESAIVSAAFFSPSQRSGGR